MNPSNPETSKMTLGRREHEALKTIHRFSRSLAKSMYSSHKKKTPDESSTPTSAEELTEWVKTEEERKIHDQRDGYFFDFPYRESSFNDSMGIAIYLAENGHYTQSMAMLRLALNTLLTSAMKSIVVSFPNRIEESDLIKKMFFSKTGADGKPEIDYRKIEHVDLTQSRTGVLSRIELTHEFHRINIRDAIKELENSKIIAKEDKWATKRHLRVHILQSHSHAHDNVVDRYRIESWNTERQFDEELWDEFQSIALAILDLKLCFTRKFNSRALDLIFKSYVRKEDSQNLGSLFFNFSQYVPVFSSDIKGGLTHCIECKTRPLATGNMKKHDFVCGTCKKSKELTESEGTL